MNSNLRSVGMVLLCAFGSWGGLTLFQPAAQVASSDTGSPQTLTRAQWDAAHLIEDSTSPEPGFESEKDDQVKLVSFLQGAVFPAINPPLPDKLTLATVAIDGAGQAINANTDVSTTSVTLTRLNRTDRIVEAQCTYPFPNDATEPQAALIVNDQALTGVVDNNSIRFPQIRNFGEGKYACSLTISYIQNGTTHQSSSPNRFTFALRSTPLQIVAPYDFSTLANDYPPFTIVLPFNTSEINTSKFSAANALKTLVSVTPVDSLMNNVPNAPEQVENVGYQDGKLIITLLGTLKPGVYRVKVQGTASGAILEDLYGNPFVGNSTTNPAEFTTFVHKPVGAMTPLTRPGIYSSTGVPVDYPEFTKPREIPKGFNPSDKVETRVSRLYYYRDAHRVAQVLNRRTSSYNRAAVDVQQQLAEDARRTADNATDQRQQAEREAVRAAQATRELERQQASAQQELNTAVRELRTMPPPPARQPGDATDPVDPNATVRQSLRSVADSAARRTESLRVQIDQQRDAEAQARERWQQMETQENRAREDQFRRETAAAKADPDTYAPGNIASDDPVAQVSISVIGEGLIHLRGPLKGINIVRQMINQIDSPVGQVKVQIHTVQINGEKAERMEVVADNIQRQIDQSRFLTLQSGEMLRKAVVMVASQKADLARELNPGATQYDRDQRYLHAFFGRDFIDELQTLDSEFLRTGNKLLSLHSMDTTSLSSAFFLMALASNSTRKEIVMQFEELIQRELTRAEASYLEAGLASCEKKHFELKCRQLKLYPLAQNARFETVRGFFDAELAHDETITPVQREFIRLGQIFKSRLITELQYKQRVRERALIEERMVSTASSERDALLEEERAAAAVLIARKKIAQQRGEVQAVLTRVISEVEGTLAVLQNYAYQIPSLMRNRNELLAVEDTKEKASESERAMQASIKDLYFQRLRYYRFDPALKEAFLNVQELAYTKDLTKYAGWGRLSKDVEALKEGIRLEAENLQGLVNELRILLSSPDANIENVYRKWQTFYHIVDYRLWNPMTKPGETPDEATKKLDENASRQRDLLKSTEEEFQNLLVEAFELKANEEQAKLARRPLDHKKFLDMLIDDMEDKYIELIEGTRAHTANIDNYIKRLTTAMDDDFSTQFYNPTFRRVREASQFYDVQFGQVETTSILANNRQFAKVSPQATMEFDLPERDILLVEGMNDAKALIDDFGALVNDPSFLALASGASGSTALARAGQTGGMSTVRDVLPGLDGSTREQVLAQQGPGRSQFGAALENLIPDPAIYKFETGTGYEIRPVVQPDGQAVVFNLHYMYTTNIREPVRADEKHLGRVKRHFIDTDVQLSNYELREVSRYVVALKASRTSRGVPLLEDVPVAGVLFRPLPQQEASLQENIILAQATIFPTLFDLMGLRWAPAVADLDPLRLSDEEFTVRGRHHALENRVYDHASERVDEFLRIPEPNRRPDLYRVQESIPIEHPNGYIGPGLDRQDTHLQEGYQPQRAYPQDRYAPAASDEGTPLRPGRRLQQPYERPVDDYPLKSVAPPLPDPLPRLNSQGATP